MTSARHYNCCPNIRAELYSISRNPMTVDTKLNLAKYPDKHEIVRDDVSLPALLKTLRIRII